MCVQMSIQERYLMESVMASIHTRRGDLSGILVEPVAVRSDRVRLPETKIKCSCLK